jgi:hypothetical protein
MDNNVQPTTITASFNTDELSGPVGDNEKTKKVPHLFGLIQILVHEKILNKQNNNFVISMIMLSFIQI